MVIGLWLMLILVAGAVSEISFLVTKFSRFSEEIFTGIVAIFFTYEAVKTIIGVSGCASLLFVVCERESKARQ